MTVCDTYRSATVACHSDIAAATRWDEPMKSRSNRNGWLIIRLGNLQITSVNIFNVVAHLHHLSLGLGPSPIDVRVKLLVINNLASSRDLILGISTITLKTSLSFLCSGLSSVSAANDRVVHQPSSSLSRGSECVWASRNLLDI